MKNLIALFSLLLCFNYSFSQTGKIDVNNINATINPSNVMFQTLAPDTNAYFEAIKGSKKSTIYSSALWMSGIRASDSILCGSFQSYIDTNRANSFSTGPLSCVPGSGGFGKLDFGAATISASEKARWNNVFYVNKWEIEIFLRWYRCSQDPLCNAAIDFPGYSIPVNISNWPAHGDVSKGQDYYMAPFYDNDGDGNYNPASGDYPCIKGDQYCWFVINDRALPTTTDEMGIEIHVEVYSFNKDSLNPLSNTIFVGRDIINRSTETYNDFIISQQTDLDIGCGSDDYIGSMQGLNSYYGYNADAIDDNCNQYAVPYGIKPPAQGVTFLNKTMTSSMVNYNSLGPTGSPNSMAGANNYMNGKWRDGTSLNYGGNGYPIPIGTSTSGVTTNYAFPYITPTGRIPWTEVSESNYYGDRKMIGSVGPIILTPGQIHEVDIAYVFSRSDSGHLKSVDNLYRDIKVVQSFYNDSIPTTCKAFVLSEKELQLSPNDISVFPNPANQSVTIQNKTDGELNAEIFSIDGKLVISKFEVNSNNKIDISKLNHGMYLINVTNSKNQVILKKLIKN